MDRMKSSSVMLAEPSNHFNSRIRCSPWWVMAPNSSRCNSSVTPCSPPAPPALLQRRTDWPGLDIVHTISVREGPSASFVWRRPCIDQTRHCLAPSMSAAIDLDWPLPCLHHLGLLILGLGHAAATVSRSDLRSLSEPGQELLSRRG